MAELPEPLVSVVLSSYNNEHTIATAIQSILDQTITDLELVIVDDGSQDRTTQIIERFRDQRVRFLREPAGNRGHAARLNQCVRQARGRYIARMDGDDVAFPQRFERQIEFLESHPRISLVGTGAVIFKGNGQAYGLYSRAIDHRAICARVWWGFPLAHPTWMARREWFLSHPYREANTRCEDQELLLNSLGDSRFAAVDEVLLGYRMEKVMAVKLARGRMHYCVALIRRIKDMKSARIAAHGVIVHALAYARDITLNATGSMNDRSRVMFRPLQPEVASSWERVWQHATRFGVNGPGNDSDER